MAKHLIFVIGPTNAGKGCFLAAAQRYEPDRVGLVEVGKMFRAKYLDPKSPFYDPDHFKGQAAPKHTAIEAWQMMLDGISVCQEASKDIILVDGQPRDIEQCERIHHKYELSHDWNVTFAHIYAPANLRLERAMARDAGDPAKLALSKARLQGDAVGLYEVMTRLIHYHSDVVTLINDGQVDIRDLVHDLFNAMKEINPC
jgi:adenylate kinase family enzyme